MNSAFDQVADIWGFDPEMFYAAGPQEEAFEEQLVYDFDPVAQYTGPNNLLYGNGKKLGDMWTDATAAFRQTQAQYNPNPKPAQTATQGGMATNIVQSGLSVLDKALSTFGQVWVEPAKAKAEALRAELAQTQAQSLALAQRQAPQVKTTVVTGEKTKWLPWVIGGGVVIAGLSFFLLSRRRRAKAAAAAEARSDDLLDQARSSRSDVEFENPKRRRMDKADRQAAERFALERKKYREEVERWKQAQATKAYWARFK